MPRRGESAGREVTASRRRGSVERESAKKVEEEVVESKPKAKKEEAGKVIKRNPLETKVRKYLDDFAPELVPKIEDFLVRQVKSDNGDKYDSVFITFTAHSEDEDENEAENIMCIKDLLFINHTELQDKKVKGKQLLIEVLPPEEGDDETPYIVSFIEATFD